MECVIIRATSFVFLILGLAGYAICISRTLHSSRGGRKIAGGSHTAGMRAAVTCGEGVRGNLGGLHRNQLADVDFCNGLSTFPLRGTQRDDHRAFVGNATIISSLAVSYSETEIVALDACRTKLRQVNLGGGFCAEKNFLWF
jgi:hypothetical protein